MEEDGSVCYIKHLFFQTKIVLPIRKQNCVTEVMVNFSFFRIIVILKEKNIYFALAKRWRGHSLWVPLLEEPQLCDLRQVIVSERFTFRSYKTPELCWTNFHVSGI